jgi:hypothetical protein
MRIEALREHVMWLLEEYQITYSWHHRNAYALHSCDEVVIKPIRSPISYAIALHEIGHIRGRFQCSRRVLVRERFAWRWARANAIVWTPQMEQCAGKSLAGYEERIRERKIPLPTCVCARR